MAFVLIDACFYLFSKKLNFMVDLCSKYAWKSDVELVEKHEFGAPFVSFLCSGGIG